MSGRVPNSAQCRQKFFYKKELLYDLSLTVLFFDLVKKEHWWEGIHDRICPTYVL